MDLKAMRERVGLSQSRFAGLFNIPVRTLQQWEQGRSSPPDYVAALMQELLDAKISPHRSAKRRVWDASRFAIPEKTRWRICIDEPFLNCERIYPIQQWKVKELLDDVTRDSAVKKVVVFGSSVTQRCHQGSDVDVYIELDENRNPISQAHDFPYDLWTNHSADARLLDEIARKGVTVYE